MDEIEGYESNLEMIWFYMSVVELALSSSQISAADTTHPTSKPFGAKNFVQLYFKLINYRYMLFMSYKSAIALLSGTAILLRLNRSSHYALKVQTIIICNYSLLSRPQ